MSNKQTYHHGDLRSGLLDAAVALIAEHGVRKLSLRECARRLSVSHAAPYRHFASKDALLRALVARGFDRLAQAGRNAIAEHTDARGRLDAYGVAYVQFAMAQPEHYRLMFGGVDRDSDTSETNDAFGLLCQCAKPLLPDGEDPTAAAFAFWSLVHGVAMLLLEGHAPMELMNTPEKIEKLTRGTFTQWRG